MQTNKSNCPSLESLRAAWPQEYTAANGLPLLLEHAPVRELTADGADLPDGQRCVAGAALRSALQCNAMRCGAVRCGAVRSSAVRSGQCNV